MIEFDLLKMAANSLEVSRSSRKIEYLLYHIPRCTNEQDKIKLTIMVVFELAYSVVNLSEIINSGKQIKEKIIRL